MTGSSQGEAQLLARIETALAETMAERQATVRFAEQLGDKGFPLDGKAFVDMTGPRARLEFLAPLPGIETVLLDGKDLYFEGDQSQEDAPGLPPWFVTTHDEVQLQFDGSGLIFSHIAENPAVHLQLLNGIRAVQELGTEEIDGHQTRHFEGTIDLQNVAEKTRGAFHDEVFSFAVRFIRRGVDDPTVGVWIDVNDLVRRVEVVLDYSSAPDPNLRGQSARYTFNFESFGRPFRLVLPSGDKVVPLREFIRIRNRRA